MAESLNFNPLKLVNSNVIVFCSPGNTEPELSGPTVINATVGETVELQFTATDDDGDDVTFTATGLPQGATFNRQTGKLTWTIQNTEQVYLK